jgi:hypothetical protein
MCSVGALLIAVLDLSVLQPYFLVYFTLNWISDPIKSVVTSGVPRNFFSERGGRFNKFS